MPLYYVGPNVSGDPQVVDIAGLTPTDNGAIVGNGANFVVESGATLKTSLGLTIGTDIQAYDAQLADVAGLTPTDNGVIIGNGSNFVVESGATLKTSLGLTIGADVQAYNSNLTAINQALTTTSTPTFNTVTASQSGSNLAGPTLTGTVTLTGVTVRHESNIPIHLFKATTDASDAKVWRDYHNGEQHIYQTGNDAEDTYNTYLTISRSGASATLVAYVPKLTSVAGIGVGNSASATVIPVANLVKKIEVFDASGSSLGFLPVYSSIT